MDEVHTGDLFRCLPGELFSYSKKKVFFHQMFCVDLPRKIVTSTSTKTKETMKIKRQQDLHMVNAS